MVMLFNDTFNNMSAISWPSVLLVKETGVPAENHRSVASHLLISKQTDKISQQPENWENRNGPDLVQAFPKSLTNFIT